MNTNEYDPFMLKEGTILNGKYRILKKIAQGGFGLIYLAIDIDINIKVVIKEFFPYETAVRYNYNGTVKLVLEEDLKKFHDEARRISMIEDLTPNIVSVKGFFRENGTEYIVMEYIRGVTLEKYLCLNQGKISWEKTLEIMIPIMDSLYEVHKIGIIHRDISLDNIMITSEGIPKLIDFGISRFYDSGNELTAIFKEEYAPAEQRNQKELEGPYSDIYSLCVVMYRMMTGESVQSSIKRKEEDKLKEPLYYDKSIPKYISKGIMQGLSTDKNKRPRSVKKLKYILQNEKKKRRILILKIFIICIILETPFAVIYTYKTLNTNQVKKHHKEIVADRDINKESNSSTINSETKDNKKGAETVSSAQNSTIPEPIESFYSAPKDDALADDLSSYDEMERQSIEAMKTNIITTANCKSEDAKFYYEDFDADGKKEMFGCIVSNSEEFGTCSDIWFSNGESAEKIDTITSIDTNGSGNLNYSILQLGKQKEYCIHGVTGGTSGALFAYFYVVEDGNVVKLDSVNMDYLIIDKVPYACFLQNRIYGGESYHDFYYYMRYPLYYRDKKYYIYDYEKISQEQFESYNNSAEILNEKISTLLTDGVTEMTTGQKYEGGYWFEGYSYIEIQDYYLCSNEGELAVNLNVWISEDMQRKASTIPEDEIAKYGLELGRSPCKTTCMIFDIEDNNLNYKVTYDGHIDMEQASEQAEAANVEIYTPNR